MDFNQPVTQEFLIQLSGVWLAFLMGWKLIVFLSTTRKKGDE